MGNIIRYNSPVVMYKSIENIPITSIHNQNVSIKVKDLLKGKRYLIVVNTACKCMLTKDFFFELEYLYQKYKD